MRYPFRNKLLTSSLLVSATLLMSGMADAQQQAAPGTNPGTTASAPAVGPDDTIVVTGTLFRRRDTETASPVTVISSEEFEKRNIQTVQGFLQTLSSSNGPALVNSFTANGAFAGGASGISLRGLTTNSTLVLIDGLRSAYYPLADDGVRNFVDVNTIPDEIVDHVDVLEDGASSTYGADAIAGVVNIITKKQVVGLYTNAEAGISQRGDAANHRLSATYGFGDLGTKGYNFYVSAHYIDSAPLFNRDLGYPYNTADQSGLCYQGACGPNNIANGVTNGVYNGLSTATNVILARPYDATNTTPLGRYQLLNPALGCQGLTPYTLSPAEFAANTRAPATVCQQDLVRDTSQIEPDQYRWGISARGTVQVGSRAQAYLEANFERSSSTYLSTFGQIRANGPAGIDFPPYSTAAGATILTLPIYVCPRGTAVACTAANGTLNPNNPFAAQGEVARIIGRLPELREQNQSLSDVYRVATGIDGSFGDGFDYTLEGTAVDSQLKTRTSGYVFIQHLLDEINDGSLNLLNPQANSAATLNYLAPPNEISSNSHLYQGDLVLRKKFFHLPGGQVQAAIGASVRYEDLYNPSGNPDYNGPTQRYFVLNAFGAAGHRNVEAGFFSLDVPVFKQLDLGVSGRYDTYSSGQSHFSPHFEARFTPVRQVILRGTYSEGFRIPSFAELGALPTTGYVTFGIGQLPQSFINQHLVPDPNNPGGPGRPSAYLTGLSVGETTVGTPGLRAEKSRSFTFGTILKPINNVTFSVDYYNIRKTDGITAVDFGGAINNYLATGGLKYNNVTIVPGAADIDNPNSLPFPQFAQGGFINANKIETSGIDFKVAATHDFGAFKFTSSGSATWILKLSTTFADGTTQNYVGTLGNFNLTAGSGTPEWRANWRNTIDFGRASLTATAYYTDGYNYSAEDQTGPGTAGQCGLVPTNLDGNQYQPCNVSAFVYVDLHGEIKVTDNFTFYGDVQNVGDSKPPIDATTYGGYLYNPVVGDAGIIGRAFKVGVRAKF